MILSDGEIKRLIEEHGLIQDVVHLETQLTPNGFDLTAGEIHEFVDGGRIDFSNDERELPETRPIPPETRDQSDEYGWWRLSQGVYKIRANETVNLPPNMMALTKPRSSLLRSGVHIGNAAWEAGFKGQGEFLLHVANPDGIEVKENARVNQIVFLWMSDDAEELYTGQYQED